MGKPTYTSLEEGGTEEQTPNYSFQQGNLNPKRLQSLLKVFLSVTSIVCTSLKRNIKKIKQKDFK